MDHEQVTSSEQRGKIIPVKISLTSGDVYTLWAPLWESQHQMWQAFLGNDDAVVACESPGALLHYVETTAKHDLTSHPNWERFSAGRANRVVPSDEHHADIVGVPAYLADRPSYTTIQRVKQAFHVAHSLAEVAGAEKAAAFFNSHSAVWNVDLGFGHYSGDSGLSEWTALGRLVAENWDDVVDSLDEAVSIADVDEAAAADGQQRIDAAIAEEKQAKAAVKEQATEEAANADPYDTTVWTQAGIDPISIALDGRALYTLRTYVSGQPVFLGRYGEIFVFSNRSTLARWVVDHDKHDLAKFETWQDLVNAANQGELEVTVHPDNAYSFTHLVDDIAKGPTRVDVEQLRRAYELLADAADWAADDSLNSVLLARPQLQEFLTYMLGRSSSYVPDPPFTAEAEGWKALEDTLRSRLSR